MNRDVFFLKQLRELSCLFQSEDSTEVIGFIRQLVIDNADLLTDDADTVSFLNLLFEYANVQDASQFDDLASFISALTLFWIHFLCSHRIDVFYVGTKAGSEKISHIINDKDIGAVSYTFIEKIEDVLSDFSFTIGSKAKRPVIIFDSVGSVILRNAEAENAIGYIGLDDATVQECCVTDDDVGFYKILHDRYQKLTGNSSVERVFVGSSYTFQGLPEILLTKSTNLSVFAGDLSLSCALVKDIIKRTHVKEFFIALGYHDMFYELSMGRNGFFRVMVEFCTHHNIDYKYSFKTYTDKKIKITSSMESFLRNIFSVNNATFDAAGFSHVVNMHLNNQKMICQGVESIEQQSFNTSFCYEDKKIFARVAELSKCYGYKRSFLANKSLLEGLVSFMKKEGAKLTFLVPPFLPFYNTHYHHALKTETLDYISSLVDNKVTFLLDFSTDPDFTPEDFYDADHLNFTGAKKLCEKMQKIGIAL